MRRHRPPVGINSPYSRESLRKFDVLPQGTIHHNEVQELSDEQNHRLVLADDLPWEAEGTLALVVIMR